MAIFAMTYSKKEF